MEGRLTKYTVKLVLFGAIFTPEPLLLLYLKHRNKVFYDVEFVET